jgi:DNA-binding beta-propeller fold protein YncE
MGSKLDESHSHSPRRSDGKRLGTVGLPCRPLALAYGAGRIWIASSDRPCSLMAIDPRSGDVLWSKPLHQRGLGVFSSQGWGANGIAFANKSVWATIGVSGLVRVSPAGKVEHTFVVGPDPRAVAAAQASIWVSILGPAQLVEIDPISNSVGPRVSVGTTEGGPGEPAGPVPCTLAGSGQTVWAPANGEGTSTSSGIWRVDALQHRVSAVIRAGGNPCGVSLGHGKVWVTNPSNQEVDEISPLTDKAVRTIPLDAPPNAIAAAPRHVWVVTG